MSKGTDDSRDTFRLRTLEAMQRVRTIPHSLAHERARPPALRRSPPYAAAILVPLVSTGISALMYPYFDQANLIMVYTFGVAYIALTFDRRETIVASILSVLAFDLVCTEPRYKITHSDIQYLVTLFILLGVSVLINGLASRLRDEAAATAEREGRTAALYRLSKELSNGGDPCELAGVAQREIASVFAADVALWLAGSPEPIASESRFESSPEDEASAHWALAHNEATERNGALFLPLRGSESAVGVLAFRPLVETAELTENQRNLLETFANGVGVAIERAQLATRSQQAILQAEGQKARNALLSSISHDLRTPLAAIASAAGAFSEGKGDSRAIAATIYHESIRLNLQIQNLLDMTRFQSGPIELRREWHSLEELVGICLHRMQRFLGAHSVSVRIAPDLPLLDIDGDLFSKVVMNLVENAALHTPSGTPIELTAGADSETIWIAVSDRGPGIPEADREKIFEPFVQANPNKKTGTGLGLAICQTIVQLHQGAIYAKNRHDGPGAEFVVTLPRPQHAPEVPIDES